MAGRSAPACSCRSRSLRLRPVESFGKWWRRVDFKKELAQLYAPKNKDWELVEVPVMNFLMVDGRGDPNTARDYSDAVEALYALAYAIKFLSRKRRQRLRRRAPRGVVDRQRSCGL
jgi:hypothetical protein